MNFEEYLLSKRIDSAAFNSHEPDVWESWKKEFDQVHPVSFTSQKLYLINPTRRKYLYTPVNSPPLAVPSPQPGVTNENAAEITTEKPAAKSPMAKPVFRPKPKMN